jgi:leader peptidase (prepilin peptidase)/N-methyltransferase
MFLQSGWAVLLAALFGAIWGSFFNVCIARIPLGRSVVRPASHCFSCGAPVRPFDNVPVLSYLLLRGRCRGCGTRFSARYLLVELLVAALSVAVFWIFVREAPQVAPGVRVARYAVFFAFVGLLVVLSFIDLDTKRLPDVLTLPAVPIMFAAGFGTHIATWQDRAIGAVAGYLFVRLVSDAYYYLRGREGLGLGDGKLLAVIGATLGWKALPPVIFGASLAGVLVSIPWLLLARRQPEGHVPDAPEAPARSHPGKEPTEPPRAGVEDAHAGPESAPALRHAQVPFGPFLSAAALIYLFGAQAFEAWMADALLR